MIPYTDVFADYRSCSHKGVFSDMHMTASPHSFSSSIKIMRQDTYARCNMSMFAYVNIFRIHCVKGHIFPDKHLTAWTIYPPHL